MINMLRRIAKRILPQIVKRPIYSALMLKRAITPISKRECNICGYKGYFRAFGRPLRLDARCPGCDALERHRLFKFIIDRNEIREFMNADASILHFAPEEIFEKIFREHYRSYCTADLFEKADLSLNIEEIKVDNKKFDIIIGHLEKLP